MPAKHQLTHSAAQVCPECARERESLRAASNLDTSLRYASVLRWIRTAFKNNTWTKDDIISEIDWALSDD